MSYTVRSAGISPGQVVIEITERSTVPLAVIEREAANLRACGFKLANDGHDTRALQLWLGHKNIQHTVRYSELSPARFKSFWRD